MKAFSKKELAWVSRLQKTLDTMPKTLQVFDNESYIAIFKGELPITDILTVDSGVEHKSVSTPRGQWECGAW